MKKFMFLALALAMFVTPAFAAIEVQDQDTREGNVSALNFSTGLSGVKSGSTYTITTNGVFEGATADDYETTLGVTDPTADRTVTIPDQTGTVLLAGAATALTPGATPTLTVLPGNRLLTYQPADNTDATFNASGAGSAGDRMTFIFTTDAAGSGDEVMTFGTNMLSTGTLTMANLAADIYVVSFVSNGTKWCETGRTTVQTT